MVRRLKRWVDLIQSHADRWWYAPAIALLAALDSFLVIIPTDGLLVGASMLAPRRWIYTALIVTLGSSTGALVLAALLEYHGLPLLLYLSPGLDETAAWNWSVKLMEDWGEVTLFLISLSPIMQQPAVALAALAGMPLVQVFLFVFFGRLLKYGFLSWLATHAPNMLNRVWGLDKELEEVGVVPPKEDKKKP